MLELLTSWYHYLVANPSTATLLIGGVLFVIAFVVLQMTKWGHDNPVAKCVALSVFAHVILLAYAYTTNLITHVPAIAVTAPVPIRLADVPIDQVVEENQAGQNEAFWNGFRDQVANEVLNHSDVEAIKTDLTVSQHLTDADMSPDLAPEFALDSETIHEDQSLPPLPSAVQEIKQANQALQAAMEQSLTPRNVAAEPLPTTEASHASAQDSALAEQANPLRENGRSNNQNQDQWLAEQLAADAPQRIESNLHDWQIEASNDGPDLNVGQFVPTGNSAERLQQLTQNSAMSSSQPNQVVPTSTADQNNVQLPRAAIDAGQLAEGRRRLGDGKPMPTRYQRRHSRPIEWLKEQGGSEETEAAIARSLAYLAAHQEADGSWNPRNTEAGRELQVLGHNRQGAGARADTGITGLALLAFLGAGNSHLEGPYKENVRKGLEYLIGRQQRNGSLAGSAQFFAQMYCHSMALLALSEAYSVSGDARMAAAVERGVAYSIQAQNKTIGGWRYQPGDSGDMSQFGWQVLAINSAALGGQSIPAETHTLMRSFLKRHTQGTYGGLAFYRYGEKVNPAMTAEAMLCRYLLNQSVSPQTATEATLEIVGQANSNGIPQHLPGNEVDNVYFWYYATLALHQMAVDPANANNRIVQTAWQQWNQKLKDRLLTLQVAEGEKSGSWNSENFMWGCYGGRVYTTAMSTMCLQVYYRYDLSSEQRLNTAAQPVQIK